MKKKFLGKKVLVSLLAGGMLYSGGALLPDFAVDKTGRLLPGMINLAMADDYRGITDHIKFDLSYTAAPTPDDPDASGYTWIGDKTLRMDGEYTVSLKGTGKTLGLSVTGSIGSGSVVIESGSSITVGADRYIYPLVKIGSGDTSVASLSAKANQLLGSVVLQKNSVLNLDAGTFNGTIQSTGGENIDGYTAKIVIAGDVTFSDESAIKFGKSKPRGTTETDNSKVLEIATGAELTIRADKLIFDEGNNLLKNNASLVLKGGVLGANVIVEGTGTTNIQDTVTMNANQIQTTPGGIQLKDESVLNLTGTTDGGKTTGELQVKIEAVSGAKGKVVVGSGQKIKTKAGATTNIGTEENKVDIENAGNVDFTGDIAGTITNSGGDTANVGFKHTGNMLGSVTNTGNYEFADSDKSIQKGSINNSGKMLVKGSISIASDTNGTITNSGEFTAEKGIAAKKIINNVGGTFTATGNDNAISIDNGIENKLNATMTIDGTLTGGLIDNSGTLTTNGPVANDIDNQSTGTVTAGGVLTGAVVNKGDFTVDAGNISTTSFNNSGTLHLGGADGASSGKLTKGIVDGQSTKTGILEITGADVVVDSGVSSITQKSLTIDNEAKLTTDLDKLTISDNFVTNKGTLVISDDSILTLDIKDNSGTTELTSGSALAVGENHTIEGTLKGNGGIIDMTERGLGVLKPDTDLQKLENAKTSTLTIGKLTGNVDLKIDVDMANFTADKLTVGAAEGATVNLKNINVVKDYIPQKDDYGTDDFEINVPTVIDGIKAENPDAKAQNAITYVDGAGASGVNYTIDDAAKVPAYITEPTTTAVVTNNYKYTFALGDTKGTLDYKVEQLNVMFKDFIEGTLPGYGTADGDNTEVDPSILCLTDNMTIKKEDPDVAIVADMNNTAQKNAELKINLNGWRLDAETTVTDGITVKVGDAKNLNINGGSETVGIITNKVNFDVADGGALVFDGKTEINGKITNASTGENKGVINNGELELKGAITNSGMISNNSDAKMLFATSGTVTNTGKILNKGLMEIKCEVNGADGTIENTIDANLTIDTTDKEVTSDILNFGDILIKEGSKVSGKIENKGVSDEGEGVIYVEKADSLFGTKEIINDYIMEINATFDADGNPLSAKEGVLSRDITNNGIMYVYGGTIDANINGERDREIVIPNAMTYILGTVAFNNSAKIIKNDVYVGEADGTFPGIFTVTAGKITGVVYNDNVMESIASGVAHGENGVYNAGTLTLTGGTADNTDKLASDILLSGGTGDPAKTIIQLGAVVNNVGNGTNGGWIIEQKELVVESDASLTTDVDVLHIGDESAADMANRGIIINDGTLIFTADGTGNGQYDDDADTVDTLQEQVKDVDGGGVEGQLDFGVTSGTNTFHALGDIAQKIVNVNENLIMDAVLTTNESIGITNVADEKYLKIGASNLKSDVKNGTDANKDGTVKLTAGTLGAGYTIEGGMIEISPDEDDDPASGNVTVEDVNDLLSTKGIINAKYVLTLQGTGTLADNIYGTKLDTVSGEYAPAADFDATKYGTTVIDSTGTIETEKTINNNVVVANGTLKLNAGAGTDVGTIVGGVVIAEGAKLDAVSGGSDPNKYGVIKNATIQTANVPTTTPQIVANKVYNYGELDAMADNIQGFDTVYNIGTFMLYGSTTQSLMYNISDGGSMGHSGLLIIDGNNVDGSCVSNVTNGTNGDKLIIQKDIIIQNKGTLETDADNLRISDTITNNVDKGLVLVDEGTLNTDVDGTGSTFIKTRGSGDNKVVADVTMNAVFNQKIEIGTDSILRISASNLQGDGNIDKGLLILGTGTLEKSVNGDGVGSIEYAGDVTVTKMPTNLKGMKVDDGVKVDFSRADEKQVTVSKVNIGNNTTMILNAINGKQGYDLLDAGDASITGLNGNDSISYGKENTLYLQGDNIIKGAEYEIVGGEVTGSEQPWEYIYALDEQGRDNFDIELVYISDPKADGRTKAGVIAVKALEAPSIVKNIDCDAPTVFTEMKDVLPVESEERHFLREINSTYRNDKQKGLDAWNSVANFNAVAAVTQNVVTSNALAMATVNEHLMSVKTPVAFGSSSGRARLIDTVSDNMMGMIPEIIPGGDTQSVMPQRVTGRSSRAVSRQSRSGGSSKKYQITSENQLWASYIQSKETIDGLKAGDATNNSDIKYKGASVGVDMWSTDKSIGGVYGSYVEGKVDAYNSAAITRNEIDNYGVGIYNRLDYKFASVLLDAGYVHSKNDIKQENLGREITAKPKVEAYSAGIRIEKVCAAGSSMITPFVGVRYMNVHTKAYDNNYGVHYKIDDEDVVTIPVGLKWCADLNPDSKMRFRPSLEAGYTFNIGADNNKQKISFNGVTDTVKFDALDKGNYFVRVGMEFVGSNTLLGLFYKYTKGDHVKDKKINVNLSFDF